MQVQELDVARWLDRHGVPFMKEPVTWRLNGPRGHLHASSMCVKYKSTGASTRRTETFAEADTRTVCGECVANMFSGPNRSLYTEASALCRFEHQVNLIASRVDKISDDMLERARCRYELSELSRQTTHVTDNGDLLPMRDEIAQRAKTLCESIEVDTDALVDQGRMRSALTLFSIQARREPATFSVPKSVPAVLGDLESSYGRIGHVREVLDHFIAEATKTEDPLKAAETVDLTAVLNAPAAMQLLSGCSPVQANPGENLHDFALRVWRETALDAARTLMRTWATWTVDLANSQEWMITPSYNVDYEAIVNAASRHGEEASVYLATQRWISHRERAAVIAPRPIALQINHSSGYRFSFNESFPVSEDIESAVVETALALWQPRERDGEYFSFDKALEAAQKL